MATPLQSTVPFRPAAAAGPPPRHFQTRRRALPIILSQNIHGGGDAPAPPSRAPLSLDRRGVLIGLSGLYGSTAAGTMTGSAAAHTMSHEHQHHHHMATPAADAVDFVLPSPSAPKRVRRPAHLVDDAYVAKFEEGIRKMMELPDDHPWNLAHHASHHPPGVHNGWLFFPWHRLYINFFERALGRLIGDDSFALPYWNFDSPDGMSLPAFFTADPSSALYNRTRDPAHFHPAIVDLGYAYSSGDSGGGGREELVRQNLWEIGMAFRQSLELGPLFVGAAVRPGEPLYGGRLENLHKPIHQWVGPTASPWTDMGNPHTTSGDPVFYSLHANMDRLWDIYRGFRGNRDDFTDPEWLNIAFTFHDETGRLVRASVRDALSSDKLGYTYEQVPIPWAAQLRRNPKPKASTPVSFTPVGEFGAEPRLLDWRQTPIRAMVSRTPKARGDEEQVVEVIHIKGIDVVPGEPARFDIFVAGPNGAGLDYGEYVGNFIKPHIVNPHVKEGAAAPPPREKAGLKLGIGPLVEEMEGEEKLVVTLVPRDGKIFVDGVGIELLQTDGSLLF